MKKRTEILIGGSIFILGMIFLATAVFIIKIGSGLWKS